MTKFLFEFHDESRQCYDVWDSITMPIPWLFATKLRISNKLYINVIGHELFLEMFNPEVPQFSRCNTALSALTKAESWSLAIDFLHDLRTRVLQQAMCEIFWISCSPGLKEAGCFNWGKAFIQLITYWNRIPFTQPGGYSSAGHVT